MLSMRKVLALLLFGTLFAISPIFAEEGTSEMEADSETGVSTDHSEGKESKKGWEEGEKQGWTGDVPPGQEKRENSKERMDKNDDGKVDKKERKSAKKRKERMDKNDDGKISKKERKRNQKRKERMDKNDDGKVDKKERKQMQEHRSKSKGSKGGGRK